MGPEPRANTAVSATIFADRSIRALGHPGRRLQQLSRLATLKVGFLRYCDKRGYSLRNACCTAIHTLSQLQNEAQLQASSSSVFSSKLIYLGKCSSLDSVRNCIPALQISPASPVRCLFTPDTAALARLCSSWLVQFSTCHDVATEHLR